MVDARVGMLEDGAPPAGILHSARSREAVMAVLDEVLDPEVPVLSVVELGIVRDVEITADSVTVVVTPTYSGCPAMKAIEDDILAALRRHGHVDAAVRMTFSPPWTTDWIGDDAKEKLHAYGIAPPARTTVSDAFVPLLRRRAADPLPCPYCGSSDTTVRSEFGSTACKSMHYCNACQQPFEGFKPI